MKKTFAALYFSILFSVTLNAQDNYKDSITAFRKKYMADHEVVNADDKKMFKFFPANNKFLVKAKIEKVKNADWFQIETSGTQKKFYRTYATLHFTWKDTMLTLHVYKSQVLMNVEEYADYLFLPFTDLTNGEETYENGRYIDLSLNDLENDFYTIDFNKAYNPYCAYVSGIYNCPFPPKENHLPIAVKAGEMKFRK